MSKNIRRKNWASKFINEPRIPLLHTDYGHKKVESDDDIKKLFRLFKPIFLENEFLILINIINKNGGKVRKNGIVKLNIKVIDKIIDEYKIALKDSDLSK